MTLKPSQLDRTSSLPQQALRPTSPARGARSVAGSDPFGAAWPAAQPRSLFPIPGGTADLSGRAVRYQDGQCHDLSGRESELLGYLARHAGHTVSRDEILRHVWGLDPNRTMTRTIDMHVAKLRQKLHDRAGDPKILMTVHGEGYLLAANLPESPDRQIA